MGADDPVRHGRSDNDWGAARGANQAQAIAARTYAPHHYLAGPIASCGDCHMYDSTKSQVYAGWVTESEPTYGAFRVNAVAATQTATTGQTILYAGVPVNAFFHQGWTFVSMSYLQ